MSSSTFIDLDSSTLDSVESPVATSGPRSNVLSNKLSSVLSTSYADSEIRDALGLLDAKGVKNDAETRRNLRLDAQREVIECNAHVVDDFGKVAEQLRRVGTMLATLNATCASMRAHITLAKQESAPMLDEASTLLATSAENTTKQSLLSAFTKHFILSDTDLTTLTSTAEPVNESFFAILARTKQIHKDCSVLLGAENQRLGLELLEQTSRNLDAGFKKLYTWIQREFKTLDLEDPHISGSIRRALRVLSERPTLFQNCLDFFAEAREHTLAAAFHQALTESGGGPGSAKAIEFSTHDLQRYVGDMLAWVHATTVSEKEALEGLFIADAAEIAKSMKAGQSAEPWSRLADDHSSNSDGDFEAEPTFDGPKALASLVSRNLTGVCQTLQSRIETAVRTTDDAALVYKVLNLLTFYQTMFTKQIGPNTHLTSVISNLESFTAAHFESVARDEHAHATTAASDDEAATTLQPPPYLTTALLQLSELLREKGPQVTAEEFTHPFGTLLEPPLETCARLAESIPDPLRRGIFTLNYLSTVLSALIPLTLRNSPLNALQTTLTTTKTALTVHLTQTFLDASGVSALQAHPKLDASTLESAALALDAFLPTAQLDAQDSLAPLLERPLARDILAAAVDAFCDAFEELETALDAAETEVEGDEGEEGRVSVHELYPRTSAEVRALLS